MPSNHGKLTEDELMLAFNNHKVSDLSPNLQYILEELFGALETNEIITCSQPEIPIKPDLIITYKGITMGLSIKTGTSEFIHGEPIEKFVEYLSNIGVSEKTITTILKYHFGDGTIDGTGEYRMDLSALKYQMQDEIREANTELNSDPDLLSRIITRMLFQGWSKDAMSADAIYHGNLYNGVIATKTQIMKHIKRKYWNYYDNLHVGPIFLRPHARYIGTEIKSEFSRHKIDGFWTNMVSDLKYISKKYFSYTPLNKRSEE